MFGLQIQVNLILLRIDLFFFFFQQESFNDGQKYET